MPGSKAPRTRVGQAFQRGGKRHSPQQLAKEDLPEASKPAPKVVPRNLGLKAGIDPDKLNQLVDELEVEEFAMKYRNP